MSAQICIHIGPRVCMLTYVCVCVYACMHVGMDLCAYVSLYVCMYVCAWYTVAALLTPAL